jgi:TolB-like protein
MKPSENMIRELLHRRVPQIVGVYLAAGWALLEFMNWAVGRFELPAAMSDFVVAAVLIFLPVIAGTAWKYGAPRGERAPRTRRRPDSPRPDPGPKSIAVLPFTNMSASPEMEYLSDGITEEIINSLARMEGLRVASRTSTWVYKGKSDDVRRIGQELNVGSVLEGSVQKANDRLRVTTQLVNVADGYHLWSERFDREMEDVFAIEDEIADNVARALRGVLREDAKSALAKAPTADVAAYDFYLRGRQFFHLGRRKSLEYARQMFRRAIEIDPNYALAWAGVADCGALLAMLYPGSPTVDSDLREAELASQKALELDPELAEAHAAQGLTLLVKGSFEEAEKEFQAAIQLDPCQFEARYFYARGCFQQGRLEDAVRLFLEASEVREDYQASFFAAQSLEALKRDVEARLQYRRALRIAAKHMELNPDDPRAATMQAVAHCRLGNLEQGMTWAERALAIDPEDAGVRYNVACLYALEGKVDEAVGCLEHAMKAGFGNKDWIQNDPDLDALREHPGFQALLESM